MRKPYVTPQCREYHIVEVNQMVCQSTVEVTFQTGVDAQWDGKEERVEFSRSQNGCSADWEEW